MGTENDLAAHLRSLDTDIFASKERKDLANMLRKDLRARQEAVNRRDREAWGQVKTRAAWETFSTPRIEALRRSLGVFPPVSEKLDVYIARAIEGEGYRIENLVYESRPGATVTANLYLPSPPREKMPAIVIIHSHHNPKTQGELQDMGMTWARQGCAVLAMDQLSYGDRRQHPPGPRQDYRFRYINGIQLQCIGDSLMGWMVWDVMRGIDLLVSRREVDRDRIILIGSVAGGGDPAAVAAALDSRIACAVPFNFGGPQPETPYPLPDDAEQTFNYMGDAYWESTRCLRLSGRDGFLHWVIVASVAPRHLVYAHEFSWDRERDPVWKRLEKVFAFYNAQDRLAFTHGAGVLTGTPPEATHCNNVGEIHRKRIHEALHRWFDIETPQEYQDRRPPEDLMCLTPEVSDRLKPRPLHQLFGEVGTGRAKAVRETLSRLTTDEQKQHLRREWASLLGDIEPKGIPSVRQHDTWQLDAIHIDRIVLEVEPDIVVPLLLLLPLQKGNKKPPVVTAISQDGKKRFLSERSEEIAELLKNGIAVCLPDLRGTGETSPEGGRAYQSEATSISATEMMLGQTLLGLRLRDLRSVLRHLRAREDIDSTRIALWGDSFASANPADFPDPLIGEGESPDQSEPLGGLLALFGALYEDDVCAVAARGMLAGYQVVLQDRFCYVPHDVIVPGALTAGDLCDVAAAFAPRPLRLERPVDGRNCLIPKEEVEDLFESTIRAYAAWQERLLLMPEGESDIAAWLAKWIGG